MKTYEITWHDSKIDLPNKSGRYLTCEKSSYSDYISYNILYYTLNARKLPSYRYNKDKPKKGTRAWFFDDDEYGEVICNAPDYWTYLPEYPTEENEKDE